MGGPKEWLVLQVGPGLTTKKGVLVPIPFSPGDRVICHSYTSGPTELDDGTSIMTADQVLAILPRTLTHNEANPV